MMKMSLQNTQSKKLLSNLYRRMIFGRQLLSTKVQEDVSSEVIVAEDTPIFDNQKDEEHEERIEQMRNTSRLRSHHRSMVLDESPPATTQTDNPVYSTVKWQRKLLGRYGMQAITAPIGVIWPTKADIEDAKEYERVAYPMTLQESWAEFERRNKERADAIIARDREVAANMAKMQEWKDQLTAKMAKKEAELEAAKQRKEKMMQEVRRHFGFHIDPKDERFKALLAEKEKEDKKKKKEEKKKIRIEKATARMMDLQKKYTGAVEGNSDEANEQKKESAERTKSSS